MQRDDWVTECLAEASGNAVVEAWLRECNSGGRHFGQGRLGGWGKVLLGPRW